MEKFNIAARIGLFWGLGYIAITMVLYLVDHALMHNSWVNAILFFLGIGIMYYSGISTRKDFGGIIPWKDAMTAMWVSSLIYILMFNFFSYALYQWIDPELKEELMALQVKALDQMRDFMGEEQYEKALEAMESTDSFDLSGILKSIPFIALIYFIIACLLALAIKKAEPWNPDSKTYGDQF
ncbi:MAG: DUF4199 domain-containing protein [Saprospiraceae bacterium]|nr:DUF4199 domain-containing protein [Saprospiraceae bacterium]